MSAPRKVISDVVIAPKREISTQLFREPPTRLKSSQQNKKNGKYRYYFIALAAIFVLLGAQIYASKIEVRVAPKRSVLNLDQTISLADKSKGLEGDMSFKSFSIPRSKKAKFPATGKSADLAKAKGFAIIFNKGKDAQILIASTRLETADGKIYRIPKTIVVPAAKTENGKLTPGSKETEAISDKAGAEYNIGLSDFMLPGLKESPKFNLIFGRSKTEMSGGSSGERTVVSKEDKDSALSKMISEAKEDAGKTASEKLPANSYLISPSVEFVLLKETSSPQTGNEAGEFELTMEGEVKGTLVDRAELEKFIIKKLSSANIPSADNQVKNLDKLPVKISGYKSGSSSFTMQMTGKAEVESAIDAAYLEKIVIEKGLSDAGDILSAYPALARAEVKFHPFWAGTFKSFIFSRPSAIDIVLEER